MTFQWPLVKLALRSPPPGTLLRYWSKFVPISAHFWIGDSASCAMAIWGSRNTILQSKPCCLLSRSPCLHVCVCSLTDTTQIFASLKLSSKMALSISALGSLSPGLIILSVVGILVVYEAGWIVYSRFYHPLSKIPGPWLASVSRTWYILQIIKGDSKYWIFPAKPSHCLVSDIIDPLTVDSWTWQLSYTIMNVMKLSSTRYNNG